MTKLLLLFFSVMLSLAGCASLKPAEVSLLECPKPPQLPPFEGLSPEVTAPSFLDRLGKRMWMKPSELTSSERTY